MELKVDHVCKKEVEGLRKLNYEAKIHNRDDERIFAVLEWIRQGYEIETVHKITKIDPLFLARFQKIVDLEQFDEEHVGDIDTLRTLKQNGFSDSYIARNWSIARTRLI